MTFTEQTGYRRTGSKSICQDADALLAVQHYNFDGDLNNADFLRYFESRTGICITWSPRCSYKQPFACSAQEWAEVCAAVMRDEDTPARILRGRLEDAWELWQAKQ